MKARMVWIFGVLATLPILLVYFFAVQFLNRGIDSWFNLEIRRASTTRSCCRARRSKCACASTSPIRS
jgi:nitrogen fixation/metabolism regulation signal transduction histidine kinase